MGNERHHEPYQPYIDPGHPGMPDRDRGPDDRRDRHPLYEPASDYPAAPPAHRYAGRYADRHADPYADPYTNPYTNRYAASGPSADPYSGPNSESGEPARSSAPQEDAAGADGTAEPYRQAGDAAEPHRQADEDPLIPSEEPLIPWQEPDPPVETPPPPKASSAGSYGSGPHPAPYAAPTVMPGDPVPFPTPSALPAGGTLPYPLATPPPPTADQLDAETLLRGRRRAPTRGWRRQVYRATGGLVDPGESPADEHRRRLVQRIRTPVASGHHRVAVLSLKGGVGKTTTVVGLASTLAAERGDRVVAVDASPYRGTLFEKVRLETLATVRDLLADRARVHRYADVRSYTTQSPSGLEVLVSDRDPAVSEPFDEDDYRAAAEVLEHFYSICVTDCGTGLLHSAMTGVLGLADQIVVVSSPSVDGARSASATLDWLDAHEYGDLVRTAVVVLSSVRPRGRSTVDLDRLERHFAARCRAVLRIPYDPHLEEGAEMDLDQLRRETREAYLLLAATVADGFGFAAEFADGP